jgi:hypothetical protein
MNKMKQLNYVLGFMFLVSLSFAVSSTDNSLVLDMHFDNNSSTGDTPIQAADSSIYKNHGTIIGTTSNDAGIINGALSFDGSDDYVDCGNAASLNVGQITIESWVKFSKLGTRQMIAEKHSSVWEGETPAGWWFSKEPDDTIEFIVYPKAGDDNAVYVNSTATVKADEWVHVAATYNGSSIKVYINGEDKTGKKTGTASGNIYNSRRTLVLGNCRWCNSQITQSPYFQGMIDEFRVYNRALSAEEIKAAYNAAVGITTSTASPTTTIAESTTTNIVETKETNADQVSLMTLLIIIGIIAVAIFLFCALLIKKRNKDNSAKESSKDNTTTRFCPNCGSKISPEDKFCRSCGKNL